MRCPCSLTDCTTHTLLQLRDEQERRQAEAAAALDEKAKKRAARLEV
jgi:hypothetical protein